MTITMVGMDDGGRFAVGDRVMLTTGVMSGDTGRVTGFDGDSYAVRSDKDAGVFFQATRSMLALVEPAGLHDQPAPKFGMTSPDLADYVGEFIIDCMDRVNGVGHEQYDQGGHQKFETMDLDELLRMAQEEVQDLAVYAAMSDIRLRRVREALANRL